MLFKISLRNIKRSIKDYAIYFFTLIIGVSIFYVFNAITGQTAMMNLQASQYEIIKMLKSSISATSVLVAIILALLIVYASRFLMKRRHREFAIYQTLGMSKGQISTLLFFETVIIGVFSLIVGLLLGTALSQVMSAVVADLFEADMASYKFMFSVESAKKTVIYFAIMYLAVIVLNNIAVTKMKLIDLIQSSKRTERITNRNVFLCIAVFAVSAVMLGYAYRMVTVDYYSLNEGKILLAMALGAVSTFFIFWSVSGVVLKVIMTMKRTYHRSINSFTFRQVSSVINTMVFSMTLICLMLFVTICTLASAFSIRNSMNENIKNLCPVDFELVTFYPTDGEEAGKTVSQLYEEYGYDVNENMKETVEIQIYNDPELTWGASLEPYLKEFKEQMPYVQYDSKEKIVSISDYNKLMKLYGKDELSLNQGEFIVVCDFTTMRDLRDIVLKTGQEKTIFGHRLKPQFTKCQDGYIDISSSHINSGVYIVPDEVVEGQTPVSSHLSGNYEAEEKSEKEAIQAKQVKRTEELLEALPVSGYYDTKINILSQAIGLGAIIAFLGLYIGFVFLVSCGAVLSLKCLSESVDCTERYAILRKIGVEETAISKSLLIQTGICFFAPLFLAIIHSIVGLKFSVYVLESFGTEAIYQSIGISSVILLIIYGGYFMITYFTSKRIIAQA